MPTLTDYETAVYALLQAPSSPNPLVPAAVVDTAINAARMQLAADAECIRVPATLATAASTQSYSFASIVISTVAVEAPITVRMATVSGNTLPIDIRSWEWFTNYYLFDGLTGPPVRMAQQGQGANGTLFFDPTPNAVYTVNLDIAALPIPLVNPSTIEAIPYPWTDAVQFYAAWLIFMSLQKEADAAVMMGNYKEFARRGRQESTPSVLPNNLPGDLAAQLAAAKTQLTLVPQPPARAGG